MIEIGRDSYRKWMLDGRFPFFVKNGRISNFMKMEDHLIYRDGSPHEKKELQQLGLRSYKQFSSKLKPEDWQTMNSFLHSGDMWDKLVDRARIFVCEGEGTLVGMAYLVPSGNPTRIYPAHWSYIRMVGVDPVYRGKGIAKRLTQMCINYARQSNEKIVGLHTSELMDDARHIYEKLGFRIHKAIEPIYGMKYWLYKLDIK